MSGLFELDRLSRWYGEVIALNGVSLRIEGGVLGLLGPNGAGKTTLLRLLAGQIRPSLGRIRVLGLDPFANPALYLRLGFVPDIEALPEGSTGLEFLIAMARLDGMPAPAARSRAEEVLDEVGLTEAAGRKTAGYSKGMRQRLKLAQAVLHRPELLVLDEPLSGLDPLARHQVMTLIREHAGRGGSAIVSSHILRELELMTRHILLLVDGRIRAEGDVSDIRDLIESEPRKVLIRSSDPKALASGLLAAEHVAGVSFGAEGETLVVRTRRARDLFRHIPPLALERGIRIHEIQCEDEDLESIFGYLTRPR